MRLGVSLSEFIRVFLRFAFFPGLLVCPILIYGVEISNVSARQDYLSRKVIVRYDLEGELKEGQRVELSLSPDDGATSLPVVSVSGDIGESVKPGVGKQIVWDGVKDWKGGVFGRMLFIVEVREVAKESWDHEGFSRIPEGWFGMGGNAKSYDAPQNLVGVYVRPFWMQSTEVTFGQWKVVREWGKEHGYTDLPQGVGKGDDHPVVMVTWLDAVKWCNAASERTGRKPCYEASGAVLRIGRANNITCNWQSDGFRLPTTAEWEKAAKAGKHRRYPWPGLINESLANYDSRRPKLKDALGGHPGFAKGDRPWTATVMSFQANEYGLFDMVGNVREYCWDWYSNTPPRAGDLNPRGPQTGVWRCVRGGGWRDPAGGCIVFNRDLNTQAHVNDQTGFRIVSTAREDKVVDMGRFHSKKSFDFDLEFVREQKR